MSGVVGPRMEHARDLGELADDLEQRADNWVGAAHRHSQHSPLRSRFLARASAFRAAAELARERQKRLG